MEKLEREYEFSDNVTLMDGGTLGMRLMDDSLQELFQTGIISAEEAVYRAEQKTQMMQITGTI